MATGTGTAASQPPALAHRRVRTVNSEAEPDSGSNPNPSDRSRWPRHRQRMQLASSERPGLLPAPRLLAHGACGSMTVPVVRSQSARCSVTSGEEEKRANSGSWQRPRNAPPVPRSPPAALGCPVQLPAGAPAAAARAAAPGPDAHPGLNNVPKRQPAEHLHAQCREGALLPGRPPAARALERSRGAPLARPMRRTLSKSRPSPGHRSCGHISEPSGVRPAAG